MFVIHSPVYIYTHIYFCPICFNVSFIYFSLSLSPSLFYRSFIRERINCWNYFSKIFDAKVYSKNLKNVFRRVEVCSGSDRCSVARQASPRIRSLSPSSRPRSCRIINQIPLLAAPPSSPSFIPSS